MKTVITRRLEFDAGHRVLRHESKCAHLHGHRYRIDITVRAASSELDPLGRVIDFGVVKQVLGKWVDDNWDHNMLLNSEDPLLGLLTDDSAFTNLGANQSGQMPPRAQSIFSGKCPYVFHDKNPTAENIAEQFWYVSQELLPKGIWPVRVRVFETPNCWADYKE